MHNGKLSRMISGTVLSLITAISKYLPYWKETSFVEIAPPLLSVRVNLPVNNEMLPGNLRQKFIAVKSIPSRRIFILKNVCVNGQAVVFKNMRIFIPSLPWIRDIDLFRTGNIFIQQWKKNLVKHNSLKNAALVYDDWSAANYYHWMIESLPRLLLVQKKFPGFVLIVPQPSPEYITTTIALLNFTVLYPLNRHAATVIKVQNLVLPELVYYEEKEEDVIVQDNKLAGIELPQQPAAATFNYKEAELIITVQKKLLITQYRKPAVPVKRIYISRSQQKSRRLLNEPELLPCLTKYGFEVKHFEGMKFLEQMDLLFNTAVFISVHGSNMVNILFMQKGSKVIELMNENYLNDAYYLLSSTLQLSYYAVPCKMADTSIDLSGDTVKINDADLLADIAALEQIIKIAIEVVPGL